MIVNSVSISMTKPELSSLIPFILLYLLVVRILRNRRSKALQAKYAPNGRKDFQNLTNHAAQAILKDLTELEFPKFFGFSVIFALFKVYTKALSRLLPTPV